MQSMCPICRHSQRCAIDESLRAGRDLRSLADEVGVDTRAQRPGASIAREARCLGYGHILLVQRS
jgi:hypothetical protein